MKKVLIVDDEADIVEMLSMVLERKDLSLLAAYDGEQALEIVREEQPDLVLTDIMMPRLDGRELCRQIKADPSTRDTAIILMTAVHRLDAGDCGADELIRKPFDIGSMKETVTRYLARTA